MEFDLRSLPDSFFVDPYPYYKSLRETQPIYPLPGGGYFLTRYADVWAVYRDPKRFSSDKKIQFGPVFGEDSALYEHHTTSLVFNDPPLHTHVRKAIGNALSRAVVELMQSDLQTIVDGLLLELEKTVNQQAGEGQPVDLIADYASAIPVEIIGNLLGVPKAERGPLRNWSLGILGGLEVGLSQQGLAYGNSCVEEFVKYLQDFVPRRTAQLKPADDDILARLLRWESEGQRLNAQELYHQCIFLLNAGHETTTNLIGNGIALLLHYPNILAELVKNPELIAGAVEEVLRFESSNQLGNRTTTCEVEIDGVSIPSGEIITLGIGAANRDPDQFPEPDAFDIQRKPNAHLAFGAGIHTCAGLNVARLEGQIAIGGFIEKFPNSKVVAARRAQRARFRGFDSLNVLLS